VSVFRLFPPRGSVRVKVRVRVRMFKKMAPFYFCNNFVKLASILIMFGRCIAMDMCNKMGIITTV